MSKISTQYFSTHLQLPQRNLEIGVMLETRELVHSKTNYNANRNFRSKGGSNDLVEKLRNNDQSPSSGEIWYYT
jgi:hypothetical protein